MRSRLPYFGGGLMPIALSANGFVEFAVAGPSKKAQIVLNILEPGDIYGPDFPGKIFRVLKEKEITRYGEHRTRRLVLEAWERIQRDGQ